MEKRAGSEKLNRTSDKPQQCKLSCSPYRIICHGQQTNLKLYPWNYKMFIRIGSLAFLPHLDWFLLIYISFDPHKITTVLSSTETFSTIDIETASQEFFFFSTFNHSLDKIQETSLQLMVVDDKIEQNKREKPELSI